MEQSKQWKDRVYHELLPQLIIRSDSTHDPVEILHVPEGWTVMGQGNYAAVLHPIDDPLWVVKVYAEGRPGLEDEAAVYRKLGSHPAFPECYEVGETFLILKRLDGLNLYNCLLQGIPIPSQVIRDVDQAVSYARARGLNPRDIHGKNILMHQGRGYVVDVSDFLLEGPDRVWEHFKWAYHWIYRPFFRGRASAISRSSLERLRKVYRRFVKRSRHSNL